MSVLTTPPVLATLLGRPEEVKTHHVTVTRLLRDCAQSERWRSLSPEDKVPQAENQQVGTQGIPPSAPGSPFLV